MTRPHLIGKGLKSSDRQLRIAAGRLDLLFEDEKGNLVIVEVKLGKIGRDALRQIRSYVHELRNTEPGREVSGILVCSGIMPAYESDLRKQADIRILVYGWDLKVRDW